MFSCVFQIVFGPLGILVKSSLAKIIESFNLMTRDDVNLAGLEKHTGRQIVKNSFFVSQILNVGDLHGNIIFSSL